MEQPIITYAIIAITVLTSFRAFKDVMLKQKMLFSPYLVTKENEFIRTITSGLIHADEKHLLVNMIVLYFFGSTAEMEFQKEFGTMGGLLYLLLYILGIVVSHLPAFIKHHDNPRYLSLGASGAVSAVLFAAILFVPTMNLYLLFIPIPIKAFIFGPLYLLYSQYMQKKGTDNVAHDAHFAGAIFGFIFVGLLKPQLFIEFYQEVNGWVIQYL